VPNNFNASQQLSLLKLVVGSGLSRVPPARGLIRSRARSLRDAGMMLWEEGLMLGG
jgi:hypothetical protein